MIIGLHQVQEKCCEHEKSLYMVFTDLTKAFDTVSRPNLWKVLEKPGIPLKMRNIIIALHDGMQAQIVPDGKGSDPFQVKNGTKQGSVLVPVLFALYFAVMLQHAVKNIDIGVPVSFRAIGSLFNTQRFKSNTKTIMKTICDLLFADDCALVSHSLKDIQQLVNHFSKLAKAFGLKVSTKKTEVVSQPPPSSLTTDNYSTVKN